MSLAFVTEKTSAPVHEDTAVKYFLIRIKFFLFKCGHGKNHLVDGAWRVDCLNCSVKKGFLGRRNNIIPPFAIGRPVERIKIVIRSTGKGKNSPCRRVHCNNSTGFPGFFQELFGKLLQAAVKSKVKIVAPHGWDIIFSAIVFSCKFTERCNHFISGSFLTPQPLFIILFKTAEPDFVIRGITVIIQCFNLFFRYGTGISENMCSVK